MKFSVPFFKRGPERARGALRPDPVFIIGMHRSGTSALGGVLEQLGLTVGKNVMAANAGNPKSYAENQALVDLHDRFLDSIGSVWRDPKPVRQEQFAGGAAGEFREELLQLLHEEFGTGRALIKDPRMCRLMPLWIPLILEHFPQASFLLPIRHPVEVAHSLLKRESFTMDQGLQLWRVHVLEGERATRGFPRQFSTYDQLMQTPVETVVRLVKGLGLSTDAVPDAVSRQIDTDLRHHAEPSWPAGVADEKLTLSIHQALASGEAGMETKLDSLRREYYGQMGWPG